MPIAGLPPATSDASLLLMASTATGPCSEMPRTPMPFWLTPCVALEFFDCPWMAMPFTLSPTTPICGGGGGSGGGGPGGGSSAPLMPCTPMLPSARPCTPIATFENPWTATGPLAVVPSTPMSAVLSPRTPWRVLLSPSTPGASSPVPATPAAPSSMIPSVSPRMAVPTGLVTTYVASGSGEVSRVCRRPSLLWSMRMNLRRPAAILVVVVIIVVVVAAATREGGGLRHDRGRAAGAERRRAAEEAATRLAREALRL